MRRSSHPRRLTANPCGARHWSASTARTADSASGSSPNADQRESSISVSTSGSIVAVIGLDDACDKGMPHHVLGGEVIEADTLDPIQDALGVLQARGRTLGQVDLRAVAGYHHAA